jgi:hypothetical protein
MSVGLALKFYPFGLKLDLEPGNPVETDKFPANYICLALNITLSSTDAARPDFIRKWN